MPTAEASSDEESTTLLHLHDARHQLAAKVYWALIDAPQVVAIHTVPADVVPIDLRLALSVLVWVTPQRHLWPIPLEQVWQATDDDLQEGYTRMLAKLEARDDPA